MRLATGLGRAHGGWGGEIVLVALGPVAYRGAMDMRGRQAKGRVGEWLVIVLATTVGCTFVEGPGDEGDEGVADSGGLDGPEPSDSADDGPPAASDVPDIGYCAGVSDWAEQARLYEAEVVERVNEARAQPATCGAQSFGAVSPLTMNARLRCAARVHSLDMSVRGFFDHDTPEGVTPFDRMELAGYDFQAAGENIAAGQPTPKEVVDGWMQSPGHCSNIMSPDFTEIGVGYVSSSSGELPHYWTQTFGTPL